MDERLDRLVEVERDAGRLSMDSRGRLELTGAGGAYVRVLPGVEASTRPPTWRFLKDVAVIAHALGLDLDRPGDARRLGTADGLRAAILRAAEDLHELEPLPTLPRARDALLWKWLRSRTPVDVAASAGKAFGRGSVVGVILADLLGAEEKVDPARALRLLAARAVGARRPDASELRNAVIRRWIEARGEVEPDSPRDDTLPSSAVASPDGESLEAFAASVRDLARVVPASARFGSAKVFIGDLWRAWKVARGGDSLDEQAFRARLVRANRERLLDLSRADLVSAMDPARVAESETVIDGATFHFVRLPEDS